MPAYVFDSYELTLLTFPPTTLYSSQLTHASQSDATLVLLTEDLALVQ